MSLLKYFGKAGKEKSSKEKPSSSQPLPASELQASNKPTLSAVNKKRCIEFDIGPVPLIKNLPKDRPIRVFLSKYPKSIFGKQNVASVQSGFKIKNGKSISKGLMHAFVLLVEFFRTVRVRFQQLVFEIGSPL